MRHICYSMYIKVTMQLEVLFYLRIFLLFIIFNSLNGLRQVVKICSKILLYIYYVLVFYIYTIIFK